MNKSHVYILTNKPNGVLYIGVTSNLSGRLDKHQNTQEPSFVKKYKLEKLIYAEEFNSIADAIAREKQLKNWQRQWKIELIKKDNPNWDDWTKRL